MKLPIRRRDDDPDADFERLRRPFAAQLERWPDFFPPLHDRDDALVPLVDVEETDEAYVLDVELPGVRREDVDLQVDAGGTLRLRATQKARSRVGLLRVQSRTVGRWSMALSLPLPVDAAAVRADLDHGVLRVVVPKAADARRRRIPLRGDR